MTPRGVNSQPAPALIRQTAFMEDDGGFDLRRILPAWIISGVIHVVLLSLFLLVTFNTTTATASDNKVDTKIPNSAEDDEDDSKDKDKDPNLNNDELGSDPEVQTNYNTPRHDPEVSVPG